MHCRKRCERMQLDSAAEAAAAAAPVAELTPAPASAAGRAAAEAPLPETSHRQPLDGEEQTPMPQPHATALPEHPNERERTPATHAAEAPVTLAGAAARAPGVGRLREAAAIPDHHASLATPAAGNLAAGEAAHALGTFGTASRRPRSARAPRSTNNMAGEPEVLQLPLAFCGVCRPAGLPGMHPGMCTARPGSICLLVAVSSVPGMLLQAAFSCGRLLLAAHSGLIDVHSMACALGVQLVDARCTPI